MRRLLLATGLAIACSGSVGSFGAQPAPSEPAIPCHQALEIAKHLSAKFNETPVAVGLQSNGNMLQVYASEEKGTWTVVSTTPAGMSCILATGKGWEPLLDSKSDPMASHLPHRSGSGHSPA